MTNVIKKSISLKERFAVLEDEAEFLASQTPSDKIYINQLHARIDELKWVEDLLRRRLSELSSKEASMLKKWKAEGDSLDAKIIKAWIRTERLIYEDLLGRGLSYSPPNHGVVKDLLTSEKKDVNK